MARTANQMSVAKNEDVAETVAATLWDLLGAAQPVTARDASAFRMARKHVRELLELHDSLSPDEVLATPVAYSENGAQAPGEVAQFLAENRS